MHGLNVTIDQVYGAMADVDSEDRKSILKKKKTNSIFFSVGPNWVLSMCGHNKLMGYQNSSFSLAVYGCLNTASQKLLFIRAWTSNNYPVYPARWFLSAFMNPKHRWII